MAADRSELRDAGGRCLRRPVVYLDQSLLSDGFDDKRGSGPNAAADAGLAAVVEDVARRGTLCLSFVHIVELANRPRLDEALAVAGWLDGLEHMWFRASDAAEAELAAEVARKLGLDDAPPPRLPIFPSKTAALLDNMDGVGPEGSVAWLGSPTIAGTVRAVHGRLERAKYAEQSIELFEKFHVDRSTLPPEATPEQVEHKALLKLGWQLQIQARKAMDDRPLIIGERRPTHAEITDAVLALLLEPDTLPINKVVPHVFANVGDRITMQRLRSGGFNERYQSFAMDTRHAFAAAVVDVFSCDGFMDDVMSDFRTSRGMERQISLRGRSRAAFVAELRRQCAESRGST